MHLLRPTQPVSSYSESQTLHQLGKSGWNDFSIEIMHLSVLIQIPLVLFQISISSQLSNNLEITGRLTEWAELKITSANKTFGNSTLV